MIAIFILISPIIVIVALIVLASTSWSKGNISRNDIGDIDVVILIYFAFNYIQVMAAYLLHYLSLSVTFYVGEQRLFLKESHYFSIVLLWIVAFAFFAAARLFLSARAARVPLVGSVGNVAFRYARQNDETAVLRRSSHRNATSLKPDRNSYSLMRRTPSKWISDHRIGLSGIFIAYGVVCLGALLEALIVFEFGLSGLINIASARLANSDSGYYLFIALLFVTPAVISTFAFKTKSSHYWVLWLLALIVSALGGGRGATFLLLFLAPVRLAIIDKVRVSNLWLFLGMVPTTFAFYLYTNLVRFRGSVGADSLSEFLLNSETFASWKSVALILDEGFELPFPGYSFIASFFYLVPRAVLPIKPEPPSTLFTIDVSPIRYAQTNSEITMSGLGDMISNFGVVFGPAFFGILLAVIASYAWRIRKIGHGVGTAAYVALIVFCMTFFRADIFGASRMLWSLLVILLLSQVLASVIRTRKGFEQGRAG